MNDLQKEINELKEFVVELRADRAAAKKKEKDEAWTKYVSLTIVIIAVIGAVATQWSGKYGSRVQISQVQASDQWNFFESKSIKQHLDETAVSELEQGGNAAAPEIVAEIKKLKEELAKYGTDKTNIQLKAEALEARRDEAAERGGKMGMAAAILSVSIATASICTVTKKKPLWFVAMIMAAFAVVKMIAAWV